MPADPEHLTRAIEPFGSELVIAVERVFTWYWIADFCEQHGIEFVLGHALYMKAIHGGKSTNDKIDSQKIATMLRGGLLPMAYVYPRHMRSTRNLLRRRQYFMHPRYRSTGKTTGQTARSVRTYTPAYDSGYRPNSFPTHPSRDSRHMPISIGGKLHLLCPPGQMFL
jgi:hypothetical protein